jgi:hypothetical protein
MSDRLRNYVRILLLGIAVAIGTWILGWWAVPLLGAAWGVLRRGRPRFWTAALAAVVGWWLLMLFNATRGSVGGMASLLGDIFGIGAWGMVALMYVFPGLLAGCAAQVAGMRPSTGGSA